ncbi:MAG: hypothetical protein J5J00_05650 [Deltaproteobacteria bacterium]|nr:hypothetical protein [Deltaproteobacteria bacterium]
MITITQNKFGASVSDVFFAASPNAYQGGAAVCYFVQSETPYRGLAPFKTKLINLSLDEGALFAGISSGARYKIKRAEREGLEPQLITSPDEMQIKQFAVYYDDFASQKGLSACNRRRLAALSKLDSLALSWVKDKNQRALCMHAYIVDNELLRARLLYSASHFRAEQDSSQRNMIGRANRLLHWHEILKFKELGYRHYDLGGVAEGDSDPQKAAIARFKLELGGEPVTEFTGYVPNSVLGGILLRLKRGIS